MPARTTLRAIACLTVCALCNAGHAQPLSASTSPRAALHHYGSDPSVWLDRLRHLDRGRQGTFRILQMGDSHTAEGSFIHSLRQRLQQEWGHAGIGWVYPDAVSGQRDLQVRYQSQGWEVRTSRKDRAYFPFGGILNRSVALMPDPAPQPQPAQDQTQEQTQAQTPARQIRQVTISPRDSDSSNTSGLHHITLTARSVRASAPLTIHSGSHHDSSTVADISHRDSADWTHVRFRSALPFSYQARAGDIWEVGPIHIENGRSGVLASAMGINGAQLGQWQQWRPGWQKDLSATRADLVILAYGTNEAFNSSLDMAATARLWAGHIARIRTALPDAGILIIGAPESLQDRSGRCGTRPPRLDAVQAMQQHIARQARSLYWSWEAAMGGRCSMKRGMQQGMAARDGIHFTSEGYRRAGEALAEAIIRLVRQTPSPSPHTPNIPKD